MNNPVKTDTLVITSPFGDRIINGKKQFHGGVDLRSKDFATGKLLQIATTEKSLVLRCGTDAKDNDFVVVKPMESGYDEIKYIHITYNKDIIKSGALLVGGTEFAVTQIKGQSPAHHLHFETLKNVNGTLEKIDPVLYFKKYGLKYKYKE